MRSPFSLLRNRGSADSAARAPQRDAVSVAEPPEDRRSEPRALGNEVVTAIWTEPSGVRRSEQARITNRSRHGLGLAITRPIAVRTRVSLRGGTIVKAVVQNCRREEDGYAIGLLRIPTDRRIAERRLVRGDATLIWRESNGVEQKAIAPVLNATTEGIQVQTSVEIPVPVLVRVLGQGVEHVAETRYSESNGERYLVGLRFLTASPDSPASSPK